MMVDKQFVDAGAFIAITDKSDQYHDQAFSYTDCTSFAVMQMKKLKRAFAFE